MTAGDDLLTGSLDISNSILIRDGDTISGETFDADLTGVLAYGDGRGLDVDADMNGCLVGDAQEFARGYIFGAIDTGIGVIADGEFVARQQPPQSPIRRRR